MKRLLQFGALALFLALALVQTPAHAADVTKACDNARLNGDAGALATCRKAAESGKAVAQYFMGLMYANGNGVPRDREAGFEWLKKAYENDYPSAPFVIDALYPGRLAALKKERQQRQKSEQQQTNLVPENMPSSGAVSKVVRRKDGTLVLVVDPDQEKKMGIQLGSGVDVVTRKTTAAPAKTSEAKAPAVAEKKATPTPPVATKPVKEAAAPKPPAKVKPAKAAPPAHAKPPAAPVPAARKEAKAAPVETAETRAPARPVETPPPPRVRETKSPRRVAEKELRKPAEPAKTAPAKTERPARVAKKEKPAVATPQKNVQRGQPAPPPDEQALNTASAFEPLRGPVPPQKKSPETQKLNPAEVQKLADMDIVLASQLSRQPEKPVITDPNAKPNVAAVAKPEVQEASLEPPPAELAPISEDVMVASREIKPISALPPERPRRPVRGAKAPPPAPPAPTEAWQIDLGTYGSPKAASAAWNTLKQRHPHELAKLVDVLEQSGRSSHLLAGPVDSKAEAHRICEAMRWSVPDCSPHLAWSSREKTSRPAAAAADSAVAKSWLIDLGEYGSQDAATAAWRHLKAANERLADMTYFLEQAGAGSRLVAGPAGDRASAAALCTSLRRITHACTPRPAY